MRRVVSLAAVVLVTLPALYGGPAPVRPAAPVADLSAAAMPDCGGTWSAAGVGFPFGPAPLGPGADHLACVLCPQPHCDAFSVLRARTWARMAAVPWSVPVR
jgi:hypothetical protein